MSTIRQKAAIKKIAEKVRKGEKVSVKKVMIEVGYSPHVANQSGGKLLETKGGKEEIIKEFGAKWIHGIHKKSLEAYKFTTLSLGKLSPGEAMNLAKKRGYDPIRAYATRFGTTVVLHSPAYEYIDRALDKVYKLTGAYSAQKIELNERPFKELLPAELDKEIKNLEKQLKK